MRESQLVSWDTSLFPRSDLSFTLKIVSVSLLSSFSHLLAWYWYYFTAYTILFIPPNMNFKSRVIPISLSGHMEVKWFPFRKQVSLWKKQKFYLGLLIIRTDSSDKEIKSVLLLFLAFNFPPIVHWCTFCIYLFM